MKVKAVQKKYKQYSSDTFKQALLQLHPGNSVRKLSSKFKIPRTTLQNRFKAKNFEVEFEAHNRLLSKEDETSLVNYVKWMAESNFPVTRKVLKLTVQGILKKRKVSFDSKKTPCKKWCQRFMARHRFRSKKSKQTDAGHIIIDENCVKSFYDLLQNVISKHGLQDKPERIYNVDETGFSKQTNLQAPVIVPVGQKPVTRSVFTNDHVTSVHAISASGHVVAPMIIFTRCIPRAIRNTEPKNWLFRSTKSGFINTSLFVEWFKDIFLKEIPPERPAVLILDAHSTHVSIELSLLAKQNAVEIITLPSKTTHVLQPCDQVFGPMKETFASTAISLKYVNGDIITNQAKFPSLLQIAMDKSWSAYTIKNAFKRTGVFPIRMEATQWAVSSNRPAGSATATAAPRDPPNVESECPECRLITPCKTCFKKVAGRDNFLVREGLVDVDLYDICMPPIGTEPTQTAAPTTSQRSLWQMSRLLTDQEFIDQRLANVSKQTSTSSTTVSSSVETSTTGLPDMPAPKRLRRAKSRVSADTCVIHTSSEETTVDENQVLYNEENGDNDLAPIPSTSHSKHFSDEATSSASTSAHVPRRSIRKSRVKVNYAQMHEGIQEEVIQQPVERNSSSETHQTMADDSCSETICPKCKIGFENGDDEMGVWWVGCDFCENWWHEHCLDTESRINASLSCMDNSVKFRCPACPEEMLCSVCFVTGVNGNDFAKCGNCLNFYHTECLPDAHFVEYKTYKDAGSEWFCSRCMVEN